MTVSRREFIQWAGSTSAFALMLPGSSMAIPSPAETNVEGYRKELLPSVDEVWGWQVAMNKIGPNKYTGNKAHKDYVDFLANNLKSLGLDVQRDQYKFPRWEARSYGLKVKRSSGAAFEVPGCLLLSILGTDHKRRCYRRACKNGLHAVSERQPAKSGRISRPHRCAGENCFCRMSDCSNVKREDREDMEPLHFGRAA